jgi:hypothetical protein
MYVRFFSLKNRIHNERYADMIMPIHIPDILKEYKYCNYILLIFISLSILFFTPKCQEVLSSFQVDTFNCFYKDVTGHPCKTCGMTRAIQALYSGNYQLATYYHPQSPLILLIIIIELVLRIISIPINHIIIPWIDMTQLTAITVFSLSVLL